MNVLHDRKKVVLDDRIRVDRFVRRRIGVPEINIHNLDAETEDAQPAQNCLTMPGIALFQANRKE